MGGLSGDAWPVSPWPVPRAEGQEVARDPGRIQALLCLSVSNHYQILHSNGEQAQAPLTESLEGYVRALHFCIVIIQPPLLGAVDWLCGFMFEQCIHLLLSGGHQFRQKYNTAWATK